MKKLFLSFIILTGTIAIATAQTPSAKTQGHKYISSRTATGSTDWVAYKKQISLDQQKKVQLHGGQPAVQAKTAPPKKAETVN